jgi:hypothetical protein
MVARQPRRCPDPFRRRTDFLQQQLKNCCLTVPEEKIGRVRRVAEELVALLKRQEQRMESRHSWQLEKLSGIAE